MRSGFCMDQISLLSTVPCNWIIPFAVCMLVCGDYLCHNETWWQVLHTFVRILFQNTQCRGCVWYKIIIATTQSCLGMNNLIYAVSTGIWLDIPTAMNAMPQRIVLSLKKGAASQWFRLCKQLLVIQQAMQPHHRPLLFTWIIFLCMDRSLHPL